MSLILEIVGQQGRALGAERSKTFGQDGGTIGRSLESDWPLPDSKRYLSSRHASIDYRSGTYYIVDTSKNGVFINDSEQPVGRGKPQRLFPGDRIRIGEYEINVTIENVDDTRESLLSESHVDPVDLKQRVDAPEPTGYDLVDAHTITGVGVEMLLEDEEAESLKPLYDKFRTGESSIDLDFVPPEKTPVRPAAARNPPPKPASAKPRPRPHQAGSNADALSAFFRGAGIDPPQLDDRETERLMTELGQVTRELMVGVIDCLHLRSMQKAQLKQTNTTIQARENNGLKFSANFEEGFRRLFLDDSAEYLSAVESVRGAIGDLKEHQRGLLSATRQALSSYIARLDPDQIELRASNGRSGTLRNAANKLKYWDLYKEVFALLANGPADELPQPFLDALAIAYERACSKDAGEPADSRQQAAS